MHGGRNVIGVIIVYLVVKGTYSVDLIINKRLSYVYKHFALYICNSQGV